MISTRENILSEAIRRNTVADEQPMKTTVEVITPEMAAGMLAMNTGNRRLSKTIVRNLTGLIQRSEWKTTHQGIALADDGTLLDGQHRLEAIVAADRAVRMMVTRGCDKATFTALDQGKKRSVSDALRISNSRAAVLRWVVGFANEGAPASGSRVASIPEIEAAHEWFKPILDRLESVTNSFAKNRTVAPIIFAVAVRIGMGQGKDVLPAWRAYVLLDVQDIPVSVGSLMKRVDHGTSSYRSDTTRLVLESFSAFDPARFGVPLGGVRNEELGIEKIRAEVRLIRDRHIGG